MCRIVIERANIEWVSTGTSVLVPLTPSLYVPGQLASTSTVLVDVGTGFYVEKANFLLFVTARAFPPSLAVLSPSRLHTID